jgi:HEAT repeat protein
VVRHTGTGTDDAALGILGLPISSEPYPIPRSGMPDYPFPAFTPARSYFKIVRLIIFLNQGQVVLRIFFVCFALCLLSCSNTAPSKPSEVQGDAAVEGVISQWLSLLDEPSLRKQAISALNDGVKKLSDPEKRKAKKKEVAEALVKAYEVNANREEILTVLKDLKEPAALPIFRQAAQDMQPGKTDRLVAIAAEAIGEMHDPQSISALIPLTKIETLPYVRMKAVRALGMIPDPNATEPLIAVLKTPADKQERFLFTLAIVGLGNLKDERAVLPLLDALYLRQGDRDFSRWATVAFTQFGDKAYQSLLNALTNQVDSLKKLEKDRLLPPGRRGFLAAKALAELPNRTLSKAQPALLNALEEEIGPNSPREGAAYALGMLGEPKTAEPLAKYLEEGYATRRIAVARALAMIGSPIILPALFKMMREGSYSGDNGKVYHHPRWEAARAISLIAGPDALADYDDVISKEKDAASKKIFETYRANFGVAKECQGKADCWKQKLSDPNWMIQEKAAYSLAQLKTKDAPGELIKAYQKTASYEARIAMLFAVRQIGAASKDDLDALLAFAKTEESDPEKRKPFGESFEEPAPPPKEDEAPKPPIKKYKPKQAEFLSGDPITLSDLAYEVRLTVAKLDPNSFFELPKDWDW